MKNNQEVFIPCGLAKLACSRDYITTGEFSQVISKAVQTIRKEHSIKGEAFGIRPIKIGNRLLWSVEDIASLFAKSSRGAK